MNTKIFLYPFKLYSHFLKEIPTSYTEGGKKYLVFFLEYSINFEKKTPFAYLLVPDDNSIFVSHLKKNGIAAEEAEDKEQLDNCFSADLDNLKFRPDFGSDKKNCKGRGLLIKDTNEVKKVEKFTNNKSPLTSIAFQVNKSTKTRLDKLYPEGGYKNSKGYGYELEVEPFSLEIEGLPKITRIIFTLFEKQPTEKKRAMENFQEKYEKLVSSATGKKLTLEIKRWTFTSQNSHYNTLEFQNDEQFGQITETKKEEKPKLPENSNQSSHSDQNPLETSNHGNADKILWIMIITLGIMLLLSLIYWLWKRKTKN